MFKGPALQSALSNAGFKKKNTFMYTFDYQGEKTRWVNVMFGDEVAWKFYFHSTYDSPDVYMRKATFKLISSHD